MVVGARITVLRGANDIPQEEPARVWMLLEQNSGYSQSRRALSEARSASSGTELFTNAELHAPAFWPGWA